MKGSMAIFRQKALSDLSVGSVKKVRSARPQPFLLAEHTGIM